MADHKFTLEEILNEYSADGKRSGIRHTSEQPLSRGTLETEKLVNAATSERPLSRERAGYDTETSRFRMLLSTPLRVSVTVLFPVFVVTVMTSPVKMSPLICRYSPFSL